MRELGRRSKPPAPGVPPRARPGRAVWSRSRRLLAIGFVLAGAMFVGQGFVSAILTQRAEARAERLERDSILSVEQLARVARDLDQERVLVDDHIFESTAPSMARIEQELAQNAADLREAEAAYDSLVELPGEAGGWRSALMLERRFQDAVQQTLTLSRQNRDAEARRLLLQVRDDYDQLDRTIVALIAINRNGALDSAKRIRGIEDLASQVVLAIRLAAFLVLAVLARWLMRRVESSERRLEANAEQLEARNQELDAFAGRVAHDLKNAMGPLSLASAVLRRAAADPAQVAGVSERIARSLRRTTGLLDALLVFSRSSQMAGAAEVAPLKAVLEGVLDEIGPVATELGVAVLEGEVPEVTVHCEPGLLHVVLANLIGNAVKYLRGCEERRVHVSACVDHEACHITVEDTGPGIPEHALEKIFDPFFRVGGTTTPGTGIGLATVQRIVRARGGTISVESVIGRGSRFQVRLPVMHVPAALAVGAELPVRH